MMQTLDQQLVDFAKMVQNHPGKAKVLDRITVDLMARFRSGSDEVRTEVAKMMDSQDLFFSELDVILAEAMDLNEDETND